MSVTFMIRSPPLLGFRSGGSLSFSPDTVDLLHRRQYVFPSWESLFKEPPRTTPIRLGDLVPAQRYMAFMCMVLDTFMGILRGLTRFEGRTVAYTSINEGRLNQ